MFIDHMDYYANPERGAVPTWRNEMAVMTRGASLKDVMRRLGHASTRAALIYQHADRDSERAIATGLSETIQAALADPNGHVAGTEAAGQSSGEGPDEAQDPR